MQVHKLAVTGVVSIASWSALTLAAPAAYALCEGYSGQCASPPPAAGGGTDIGGETDDAAGSGQQPTGTGGAGGTGGGPGTAGGTDTSAGGVSGRSTGGGTPSTLPFTGGELVLLTAIGAGALAGGTVLVLAGRRKAQSPA